jgi:subtilisin-like proprotein convertase family protein
MRSESIERANLSQTIPDNSSSGVTVTFSRTGPPIALEHVQLTLTATHPNRGELEITLTAPSGMVSRLMPSHADTGADYQAWTFSSVRHWGEEANGTWTLRVADRSTLSSTQGTLRSATLSLHGALRNQPPEVTTASLPPADAAGHAYSDRPLTLSEIVTSDPENDAVTVGIQWQESMDGSSWTDLPAATSATLLPDSLTPGRLVRAVLTPSDAFAPGSPWISASRPINLRPVQHAIRSHPYSYQSALWNQRSGSAFSRPALINEISQGASGTKEWVEILVTRDADLRGWQLSDRLNLYTTFADVPLWSQVRAGTLIVIHNGADRDPALPPAQSDPATLSVIAAHNDPSLFSPGNWTGLSSTNPENVGLRNAAGQLIDGVSFNTNTTYQPALGFLPANRAFRFTGGSETEADNAAFWLRTSSASASQVSPGLANGGANADLVASLRAPADFAATGLPDGLAIHPASGLISGTIAAASGRYPITIRRGSDPAAPPHSFHLFVTDPVTDASDEDLDGLPNLTELALGRDPHDPEAGPGFARAPQHGPLAIAWQSPAGAPLLRIAAEASTDLISWSDGPQAWEILSDAVVGDRRTVTARPITRQDARRSFVRLRASIDP